MGRILSLFIPNSQSSHKYDDLLLLALQSETERVTPTYASLQQRLETRRCNPYTMALAAKRGVLAHFGARLNLVANFTNPLVFRYTH